MSIEVTPEQHQRLKACAALAGKTIKEYVIERVLEPVPNTDSLSEEQALEQLEHFLQQRLVSAQQGQTTNKSVKQIFDDVQDDMV